MKHRLNRPRTLLLITAAGGGGLLALIPPIAALAGTAAPSAHGNGTHCLVNVSGGPVRCFGTYRSAITAATAGRVKDAPADVRQALSRPAVRTKIEAAGADAAKDRDGSSSVVVGTEYRDGGLTGASISFTADAPCSADKPGFQVDQVPDEWNDAISSYQTFNGCQARHFADAGLQGDATSWQTGGQLSVADGLDDRTSSIAWSYGETPTTVQLLDDCGSKTTSCDFHPKGDVAYSYTGAHEVARAFNCTSKDQIKKMTWSDITAGKNTVSTEIGLQASLELPGVGAFQSSFSSTYGHEWSWQNTVTDETDLKVPSGEVGWVNRNSKLQTAGGEYELHYDEPHWGHYVWYIRDFTGTGPVPQDMGVVDWVSRRMTAAEKTSHCVDGASVVTQTPKRATTATAPRFAVQSSEVASGRR